MMVGGGYGGYNQGYYNNYYSNNQCFGGCPPGAHCEWGFCECNRGGNSKPNSNIGGHTDTLDYLTLPDIKGQNVSLKSFDLNPSSKIVLPFQDWRNGLEDVNATGQIWRLVGQILTGTEPARTQMSVRGCSLKCQQPQCQPYTSTNSRLDVNLICNTDTTVQQGGNCECRQDMKWNTK